MSISHPLIYDNIPPFMQPKTYPTRKEWRIVLLVILGGTIIGYLLKDAPLLGWDWFHVYWNNEDTAYFYPPWTTLMVYPLSVLPWRMGASISNGLTLAAVGVLTYREGTDYWKFVGVLMAVLSIPTWYLLWDGQIDGWSMLGLLILPWGIPLVLAKPTAILFVLLTKKEWFIGGAVWGVLSLILWPGWIGRFLNSLDFRIVHPAAFGWHMLGWPLLAIGAVLLLFSKRDNIWQAISAGVFLIPFVLPYHLVTLLPILGRFTNKKQLLLWVSSWTLILPLGFGGDWRFGGYIFPLTAWVLLHQEVGLDDSWYAYFKAKLQTSS